ncbi:plasmid mobilization relaxosome protein MobC [Sphingomonas sp. ID0503]|uniref:plasmid mobilization relaxosome protein MobC n=1 Tax=Sphingomonas sp. ID0503 TaxID=3399691 RepID=UPI003AFAD3F7
MPGQRGSEVRQRQNVRTTRWTDLEAAQLTRIADYSGCSEAEVLRRLVARADRNILISRDLVFQVTKLGTNINQIGRRLNANGVITADDLRDAYAALLLAVQVARL